MAPVDPDELTRLLDRHSAPLELFARQWCRQPADVVQEAFIELARQPDVPHQILPWLYRVVRNRALSARRSENRRHRHESRTAGASASWFEPTHETVIDGQIATDALAAMDEDLREVIIARLWGGLSFDQIAEVIGVSSSTAHRRYESGLAFLRKRLGLTWLIPSSTPAR